MAVSVWFKIRKYIDEYARILGGAGVERITSYDYRLNLPNGDKLRVIVKDKDAVSWARRRATLPAFFQRLIANYRLSSILNIGPRFHQYHIVDDEALIIITEHLPHEMDRELLEVNKEAITSWIKKIHAVGVFHGDLHSDNLRMNDKNEIRMINLETMFYRDEKDLPGVVGWIENAFNMTVEEYIVFEEQELFLSTAH